MQDLGYQLPRIPIPSTSVNKDKRKGQSCLEPRPLGRYHTERSISTAHRLASDHLPGTAGRASVGVARSVCGHHGEGVGAFSQIRVVLG
jgi:hypothetical protein